MSGGAFDTLTREQLARYTTNSLREARELLQRALLELVTPSSWTKGVWARDALGAEVEVDHATAFSWCAGGAVLCAQAELYGGNIEIPVDPASGEATHVLGPKRLVAALELLGFFLYGMNRSRVSLDEAAPARRPKPLREQHPTLIASDINDLRQIAHPHVLLGLVAVLVAIHDELAARRRRRGTSAGRSDEA